MEDAKIKNFGHFTMAKAVRNIVTIKLNRTLLELKNANILSIENKDNHSLSHAKIYIRYLNNFNYSQSF